MSNYHCLRTSPKESVEHGSPPLQDKDQQLQETEESRIAMLYLSLCLFASLTLLALVCVLFTDILNFALHAICLAH